jgi:hypothetical protein
MRATYPLGYDPGHGAAIQNGRREGMSKQQDHLERAALDAHRAGGTQGQFWVEYGAQVARAEPIGDDAATDWRTTSLPLLVAGDLDGHFPPDTYLWGPRSQRRASTREPPPDAGRRAPHDVHSPAVRFPADR